MPLSVTEEGIPGFSVEAEGCVGLAKQEWRIPPLFKQDRWGIVPLLKYSIEGLMNKNKDTRAA